MEDKPIIHLSSGTPPLDPETREKFYKWLDNKHVPDQFKYKGIKRAMNCRLIAGDEPFKPIVTDYPEYLTIVEYYSKKDLNGWMNSPEVQYIGEDGLKTWGETIGRKKIWFATYRVEKSWER